MKVWLVAMLILVLHASLLFHSASQKSATVDELSHLAAGLYSYTTLDFRVHRGAPPLQPVLCAAFAWHTMDINLSFDNESWNKGIWNGSGDRLLEANPNTFHEILQRARMVSMLLSCLLLLLIFEFSRRLWGNTVSLVVMFIAALEPNFLAHGRLVTTDTATTLFLLAVGYAVFRFLKTPSWAWLITTGIATGCMWLSKQSAIVVPVALFFVYSFGARSLDSWKPVSGFSMQSQIGTSLLHALVLCMVVVVVTLGTVWAGYGFEVGNSIEDQSPADSALWLELQVPMRSTLFFFGFNSLAAYDPSDAENPLWKAINSGLPAYSHWEQFSKARQHVRSGHRGYLMGEMSSVGFTWFYPILFLVKTPVPILLFSLVGIWFLHRRLVSLPSHAWLVLTVPGVVLGTLILLNTAAIGYRHAMPILPFILVTIVGAAIKGLWDVPSAQMIRWSRSLLFVLLLWLSVTVGVNHPHHLSFFNSMIGGPWNGHHVAVDSSLDWGQDLLILREAINENSWNDPVVLYFGPASLPPAYGIHARGHKRGEPLQPGTYIISASVLQGIGMADLYATLEPLRQREPDEWVTPALLVYHLGE